MKNTVDKINEKVCHFIMRMMTKKQKTKIKKKKRMKIIFKTTKHIQKYNNNVFKSFCLYIYFKFSFKSLMLLLEEKEKVYHHYHHYYIDTVNE